MSREEFDALVTRLQTASERNPRAYNLRVVLLMLLGYGYLIGVLLGAILLTMGIVALAIGFPNALTIKLGLLLGIASGGLALALTKALWVRLDAPEGLELKLTDAPELFSLLDRLRRQFKGPRFHHILLTGDYNASVVQVPRLGVFGWQRNFLMVGLPLMQSLSPEEFEAVLAHEFGHLSANHSRFSGWIYRVRRSWEQAFEQMYKQQQGGTAILRKFLDGYWPKFNAHAFVLARASEYEADRCAAEFSGAPTIARALTRTNLHGALLEQKFWPGVYKRINTEPVPPANLFSEMGHTLRAPVDPIDSARWLKTSFTLETNNIDTHPCLKDRLRALNALPPDIHRGQFPVCIPPPASSAVHHFLGSNAGALTDKLNKTWASNVSSTWEQRRKEVEELNQELSKTDQGGDAPDAEKIWHKARALVDRDGDEAAMPVIKEVLLHDPEHAGALLVSGRYWLEKDNPAGVPLVERAIGSDEILTEAGCNLLYGFYSRTGQRDKLRELEH
ncbi:MAG: M48 family metalloprotease, partial [Limisphaerales bacterium]